MSRFWSTRTWWQRILVIVLALVAVGSAINLATSNTNTTNTPSTGETYCDVLHDEQAKTDGSFLDLFGPSAIASLTPAKQQALAADIRAHCPEYSSLLKGQP